MKSCYSAIKYIILFFRVSKSREMEVCVDNIDSLVAAIKGGASRIELCSSLSEGGLTPSMGFYKIAKKLSKNVPIHILIRPRGAFV